MASNEFILARRGRVLRWAAAGVAVPAGLGALSWVAFEAKLGMLFDASANAGMFAAPLSPFVLQAFSGRAIPGIGSYLVAIAVLAFNAALYAALGLLHWRLRAQPRVNQALWLTVVVGVGFSAMLFAALLMSFAGG